MDIKHKYDIHLILTKELIIHLVEYFWEQVIQNLEPNYFVMFLLRIKYEVVLEVDQAGNPTKVFQQ